MQKKCGNCGNLYKTFIYGSASRFFTTNFKNIIVVKCGKIVFVFFDYFVMCYYSAVTIWTQIFHR